MKIRKIVLCALFAAVIAVTAPLGIPMGALAVTLGVFSVALTAFCLRGRESVVSVAIYILIGLAGFPVFSGFKGGWSVLLSPTGGFIAGYVLMAMIFSCEKCVSGRIKKVLLILAGLCACYACGTAWYMFLTKADLKTALSVCVVPFALFDVAKIYVAFKVAKIIRKRIKI